ncbi:hypothetical protein [Breoghania sp. JC706]|uniref:hypothetical protein n=1 Tax=Breoghania sp. JC706 TaxID=3117732 RepID=UPI00300B6B9A
MEIETYEVAIAGFFAGTWKDVEETMALTGREAKYLKIEGKIAPVSKSKAKGKSARGANASAMTDAKE